MRTVGSSLYIEKTEQGHTHKPSSLVRMTTCTLCDSNHLEDSSAKSIRSLFSPLKLRRTFSLLSISINFRLNFRLNFRVTFLVNIRLALLPSTDSEAVNKKQPEDSSRDYLTQKRELYQHKVISRLETVFVAKFESLWGNFWLFVGNLLNASEEVLTKRSLKSGS